MQCHEEAQSDGQKLSLEVFVAGRNRLENVGATALSEVFEVSILLSCEISGNKSAFSWLKAIGSLVQVSMPQNGIESDGICALAKAFSKNPNLEAC